MRVPVRRNRQRRGIAARPSAPPLRSCRGDSRPAVARDRPGAQRLALCRRLAAPWAASLLLLVCGCRAPGPPTPSAQYLPQVQDLLRAAVATARIPEAVRHHEERRRAWTALRQFYRERGWQPAWWDGKGMRPAAGRLLAALDALPAEGLEPRIYSGRELRQLLDSVTAPGAVSPGDGTPAVSEPAGSGRAAELADLDLGLSYTFLVLAAHLSGGRVQPAERVRVGWHMVPPRVDLVAALRRAVDDGGAGGTGGGGAGAGDTGRHGDGAGDSVAATLAGLAPRAEGYGRLRQALASYRGLAARGGWPAIPSGTRLRLGDGGPRVAALAARLRATGELAGGAGPARFDATLAAALSRFQAAHGLPAKGEVDEATLAALDEPVEGRIRQLELNMERWRWMEGDLGNRYVLVNLPDFLLTVVDGGQAVMAMRVIVGKARLQTPVFSDLMTQIVLNPAWHIPDTIAAREIAPALLRDPGYLRRKGYELRRRDGGAAGGEAATAGEDEIRRLGMPGSPYRLVQPPGPDNALGHYKFVVADDFDVYLHDTPSTQLFARSERDFSHGCIRLEKPAELASYLLAGDPKWTPEAVAAAVAAGKPVTIPLRRPLPVHILYQTAWVDRGGTVELRDDVYGHDGWLEAELAAETPLWLDLAEVRRHVAGVLARAVKRTAPAAPSAPAQPR
jgi:L,D-transpeptidase YcbB